MTLLENRLTPRTNKQIMNIIEASGLNVPYSATSRKNRSGKGYRAVLKDIAGYRAVLKQERAN